MRIGMHICPPSAPNVGVGLEDTPSPPDRLEDLIADDIVELYPNFQQDLYHHYSNMGLCPIPYCTHRLILERLTLGSKLWLSGVPPRRLTNSMYAGVCTNTPFVLKCT